MKALTRPWAAITAFSDPISAKIAFCRLPRIIPAAAEPMQDVDYSDVTIWVPLYPTLYLKVFIFAFEQIVRGHHISRIVTHFVVIDAFKRVA